MRGGGDIVPRREGGDIVHMEEGGWFNGFNDFSDWRQGTYQYIYFFKIEMVMTTMKCWPIIFFKEFVPECRQINKYPQNVNISTALAKDPIPGPYL